MKRVISGLTAIAAVMSLPAAAGPQDARLWIGLDNSEDGFLLDQNTGDLWMTGICIKQLQPATNTGDVWTSRTAELVSVGRMQTMLDQTFTLDLTASSPQITVLNSDRGGPQSFPAVIIADCDANSACQSRMDAPAC